MTAAGPSARRITAAFATPRSSRCVAAAAVGLAHRMFTRAEEADQ